MLIKTDKRGSFPELLFLIKKDVFFKLGMDIGVNLCYNTDIKNKEDLKMKKGIVFEAVREGYTVDQVWNPMTVGELIEFLGEFDEDTEIILSHDNGYTFGTLRNCEVDEDELHLAEGYEAIYSL